MAKIYQLYYTRLGKQGNDAGWQVASASAGTPQLVKNTFYKLASNLVAIGSGAYVPPMAFDLQVLENYVFFSHINYRSVNEGSETDIRGVSFVHGFAIKAEEYRKICHDPEQILGIENSAITLNYSGQKELPLLENVSYKALKQEGLLEKYHLDQERYSNLMYCVYAALGTVGGSLVIKSSQVKGEALRCLFQDITCLVMRGLPYIFRMKVSAFSGIRQGALLCFSDELPENGAYYDLDTGAASCPQITDYEFIRQLNNLALTKEQRKQFYDILEQFADVTYGGNYEALKLNHMELAYRAACKQTSDEALDEHIKEAAALRAFKYDLMDEYYAHLVECYVKADREFPSADVFKKMQKRYVDTNCPELKAAFTEYYAGKVCKPGEIAAYDMIYRMETAKPEDYQNLWKRLEEIRPEFLAAYHVDYYLEHQITSFEKLEKLCRENPQEMDDASGQKLTELMVKFFDAEFAASENNTQRHQICKKYAGLCSCFPESGKSKTDACREMFRKAYWKKFDSREFSYKDKKEYYSMGAGDEKDPIVPRNVNILLNAREAFIQGPDIRNFQTVFFSANVVADANTRKKLVRELHEEAGELGELSLDAYLLLNYSLNAGFDLNHLFMDIRGCSRLQAGSPELTEAFASSMVLAPGTEAEEQFKAQLKEKIKDKSGNAVIKQLYSYYFPQMSGKRTELYLFDFAQKCMLFLAVSLTYIILAKYLLGSNDMYGKIAAGIGGAASVFGFGLNLILGETNSVKLFADGNATAIIGTAVFMVLSIAIIAAAIFVSTVWMTVASAVIVVLLLIGRLFLVLRACYEII